MRDIAAENIRGILLDIEGTTTSISFVYDVLFPYARQHAREFLERHLDDPGVRDTIAGLGEQRAADVAQGLNPPQIPDDGTVRERPSPAMDRDEEIHAIVSYIDRLMDRDSKAGPLKSLQGLIWEEGYSKGEVKGHVFADVPTAFERWRSQGTAIAIFSSGSMLAQKLLFRRTTAGDLTRFIKDYFDTTTGSKREAQSYRAIASALKLSPDEILFISDVTQELDAAAEAGMKTAVSIRPGNHPQPPSRHACIHSFDEIP